MWQEKNKQLYKKFEFKDFNEAFEFMNKVAQEAELQDHHPRWTNEWNIVEIWLSTHNGGKVTDKDHKLAKAIDKIVKQQVNHKLEQAKLYTDGGSRGNPGPSASAIVICNLDNTVVEKSGKFLGTATNNQAEYTALLMGLERAKELGIKDLQVMMDSELVVKQIKGLYKIKNDQLIPIYEKIKNLKSSFDNLSFTYVPRALNKEADGEVNRILDEQKTST